MPLQPVDFTEIDFEDSVRTVKVVLTPGATMPEYKSTDAAGADIFTNETYYIEPGETHMYSTGVYLRIPRGYEGQVRSRSGLAAKSNVFVLNSPGTIDSDYRGEVKVILHNAGKDVVPIHAGDRIAQLLLAPVTRAQFQVVKELDTTARGENGFGSTGR